jgi:hypothetical protein
MDLGIARPEGSALTRALDQRRLLARAGAPLGHEAGVGPSLSCRGFRGAEGVPMVLPHSAEPGGTRPTLRPWRSRGLGPITNKAGSAPYEELGLKGQ